MTIDDMIPRVYGRNQVKMSEVPMLKKEGYRQLSLHAHSDFSHDVPAKECNTVGSLLRQARDKGIDYLSITDHDNDTAWRTANGHDPIWERGMELEVESGLMHLGIVGIANDDITDALLMSRNDADRCIRIAQSNGALVIANHPFWKNEAYGAKSRSRALIEEYRLPVELNSKRPIFENLATSWYARIKGLPVVAATDTHTGSLDGAYTLVKGSSMDEMIENIRKGEAKYVFSSAGFISHPSMMAKYTSDVLETMPKRRVYLDHPVDEVFTAIGTAMQNSWINRVASSSTFAAVFTLGVLAYMPFMHAQSLYRSAKSITKII